MSSFKRKIKKDVPLEGTDGGSEVKGDSKEVNLPLEEEGNIEISGIKPWIHNGQSIVSSGHRQLDDLIGGGIPVGTLNLYAFEEGSTYSQQLMYYNLAESVSHNHCTLVVLNDGYDAENILKSIPYNSSIGKDEKSDADKEKEKTNEQADWGLKIAWQYEKYLENNKPQPKKIGKEEKIPFCCSFDLSKSVQSQLLSENFTIHVPSSNSLSDLKSKLQSIYVTTREFIQNTTKFNKRQVSRIFFPFFHNLLQNGLFLSAFSSENLAIMLDFLLKMKRMARITRSILVFGLSPQVFSGEQLLAIETIMDTILTVDSFASRMHVVPYEFREFLGFFMIKKLQQFGMLTSPQLKGTKFGIKRDRRKLHIEPLHLPPEESRATSSATDTKLALEQKPSISLETTKSKSTQMSEARITLQTEVTNEETDVEKPQSSLAASLAAARAARAATKADGAIPKPVSISKSQSPAIPKGGIDF